jgi:Arc/MetJ family transcription regulator
VAHRTTIELDEELLASARAALGTTGIRDTVEAAMRQVVRAELRRQLAEQLLSGVGFDAGETIFDQARPAP